MTSEEAADFLAKCSKRNHGIEFEQSYIYVRGVKTRNIKRACNKLDHDGQKVLALIADVPCSCGADEHNAKVDEALKTLNPVVALPA